LHTSNAQRDAFRRHLSDKPVGSGIAGQALDIGVNLCLPCPPCGIGGVFVTTSGGIGGADSALPCFAACFLRLRTKVWRGAEASAAPHWMKGAWLNKMVHFV
jgi:hypothetical protein